MRFAKEPDGRERILLQMFILIFAALADTKKKLYEKTKLLRIYLPLKLKLHQQFWKRSRVNLLVNVKQSLPCD